MSIEDKISELIGIVADLAVCIHGGQIPQGDFTSVFHIAGIENQDGENYQRTDGLIRKAYIYHSVKSNIDTASNIKAVFIRKDGLPIIKG